MSCSNPLEIHKQDIKDSFYKNHADFEKYALLKSMNTYDYYHVPCGQCINCRIDKQNNLIDRAEYEYIKYGCGSFVTFTYDDFHLFNNSFIDSKTGKTLATINKKDGKDFLNRLNKLVHSECKKTGYNPLCRKDYKYIITSEYGDKFNRPHFHVLFFGLDFAYCERLFWRAWQGQGAIQVGSIKNGGIAYVTKYIASQSFGQAAFFKYDYHHLTRPSSSHSLHFGDGLYKEQKDFIKKTGCYLWHNKMRPAPSYIKNKYNVTCDLNPEYINKKFLNKCENIKYMYGVDIHSFRDLHKFSLQQANIRQKNTFIKLQQHGKQVLDSRYLNKELQDFKYSDKRIKGLFDSSLSRIVNPDGSVVLKVGKRYTKHLTNIDCFKMGTSYNQLAKQYGYKLVDQMFGKEAIPF